MRGAVMNIVGIFHSYSDPSAALVRDGQVVAFVEEERLTRVKHARGSFPNRAIDYVLKAGGLSITDIDCLAQAWDCSVYDSGEMAAHYAQINAKYPTTAGDLAYQKKHLETLSSASQKQIILQNLRKQFGNVQFPPIVFVRHHLAHACMAYFHSGMRDALVLTIDGSGEAVTTAWWLGKDRQLTLLHEVKIPHSLGWFYAAFTEYLGFEAYDGEYKIMGLAAYGDHDPHLAACVEQVLSIQHEEGTFRLDGRFVHRGTHKVSGRFTDELAQLLGREPRAPAGAIDDWHRSLAFAVQTRLEEAAVAFTRVAIAKVGHRQLCISGGVGHNVKMNSRLSCLDEV